MPRKKVERIVAVADIETDPFKYGRIPKPFCCEIYYDSDDCIGMRAVFWGDDCVDQLLDHIQSIPTPLVIYMHNGGKFDFHFFPARLQNPVKVIHGRIVRAKFGIHEFRDSWAIIPMSLKAANQKTDIDYEKLERSKRDANRSEILSYLHDDCVYLHGLVAAFVHRFGLRLTIAGTASRELRALHPQYSQNEDHDARFRPYYFGGRVECFESGIVSGAFKVYDVNSMYPHVMREYRHPLGGRYVVPKNPEINTRTGWLRRFDGHFYFAVVRGVSRGAFPVRTKTGLSFPHEYGEFYTTSHELRAALELRLFDLDCVVSAQIPCNTQTFGKFVDTFVAQKIEAKKSKDKIAETFAKLILNSAYGRFGINPFEFYDYHFRAPDTGMPENQDGRHKWEPYEQTPEVHIWRRPVNEQNVKVRARLNLADPRGFEDVAIAASVTSAARAVLMRAIANANRPIYCDTDSIICEGLTGVRFSDRDLGAWKLEGEGVECAIAGKKLYALFDSEGLSVKSASKGVHLSSEEIRLVASGQSIVWESMAPNFSLAHETQFVKRVVKKT